jgi:hypothetical protein
MLPHWSGRSYSFGLFNRLPTIHYIDVVLGNLHLNRLSIRGTSKSSESLKTFLQLLLVSDVLREKSGFLIKQILKNFVETVVYSRDE